MAVEPMPLLFTSQAEVESIFSSLGVSTRIEDYPDVSTPLEQAAVLDDVMAEATDTVLMILGQRYAATELEKSRIVRRWTSYIACHLLSIRRGNPAQFSARVDEITALMNRVKDNLAWVPRVAPLGDYAPSVSNPTVDYRYHGQKLRIDPTQSTGTPDATQPTDRFMVIQP